MSQPRAAKPDTDAAITVVGLGKAYRRGSTVTPVLSELQLTVPRGKCVFLAGPSGSGKSTLLSIIGCILSADEGQVNVLGHDVARLNNKQRAQLRLNQIGFVFQRYHLIRGLSAAANVAVPQRMLDIPAGQAHRRALELLATLGLADKAKSLPNNLSTGQCQRVALARALVNDPELILADEPTASLDAENGQLVMHMLRRLATEEGKTVVVVTHDSRVFSFADEIHYLENGQIVRSDRRPTASRPAAAIAPTAALSQLGFPATTALPSLGGN